MSFACQEGALRAIRPLGLRPHGYDDGVVEIGMVEEKSGGSDVARTSTHRPRKLSKRGRVQISDVEQECNHISVVHNVALPFNMEQSTFSSIGDTAVFH